MKLKLLIMEWLQMPIYYAATSHRTVETASKWGGRLIPHFGHNLILIRRS